MSATFEEDESERILDELTQAATKLRTHILLMKMELAKYKGDGVDPQKSEIAILTQQSVELTQTVEDLRKDVVDSQRKALSAEITASSTETRLNKAKSAGKIGWVILFLLVIFVGFLVAGVTQNKDIIDKIEQNQFSIQQLSEKGICIYNRLFLQSYSPEAANRYPAGPRAYEEAFDSLRQIDRDLKC